MVLKEGEFSFEVYKAAEDVYRIWIGDYVKDGIGIWNGVCEGILWIASERVWNIKKRMWRFW